MMVWFSALDWRLYWMQWNNLMIIASEFLLSISFLGSMDVWPDGALMFSIQILIVCVFRLLPNLPVFIFTTSQKHSSERESCGIDLLMVFVSSRDGASCREYVVVVCTLNANLCSCGWGYFKSRKWNTQTFRLTGIRSYFPVCDLLHWQWNGFVSRICIWLRIIPRSRAIKNLSNQGCAFILKNWSGR